jgi:hypothetical protein
MITERLLSGWNQEPRKQSQDLKYSHIVLHIKYNYQTEWNRCFFTKVIHAS